MVAGVKDMMVIILPWTRIYTAFNKMGGSLNSDEKKWPNEACGGNAGTLTWFKPQSWVQRTSHWKQRVRVMGQIYCVRWWDIKIVNRLRIRGDTVGFFFIVLSSLRMMVDPSIDQLKTEMCLSAKRQVQWKWWYDRCSINSGFFSVSSVLAYQFVSPVRWVQSQDLLFTPFCRR